MRNWNIKNTVKTVEGIMLLAITVSLFYVHSSLIMGGTTGLGLWMNRMTGISTSSIVWVLNIILLGIGAIVLGKQYFFNTVLGAILYPLCLVVMDKISIQLPFNLVTVIIGAVMMGLSCSVLVSANASSGGTDSIGLIAHKLFHVETIKAMSIFDLFVISISLSSANLQIIVYSLIAIVVQMTSMKIFGWFQQTKPNRAYYRNQLLVMINSIHLK